MSRALPRHDLYAAFRCRCGHLSTWHHDDGHGSCFAGDHTVPCLCESWDGPCDAHDKPAGEAS